ncbi:hypothetical protein [Actinomycetospora lemnae]|uniref:Uncharacterized protein n=1 Tax=Actinomycetospora lemnae TaxID=3019891 RepID=A0ABT5SV43_9PSEU|nr:hypothetical protein [Actinomycetospora sp. DW7H6]MDD7966730.1 hypothetical protein [Actinomycetospora sp. DW7H6]
MAAVPEVVTATLAAPAAVEPLPSTTVLPGSPVAPTAWAGVPGLVRRPTSLIRLSPRVRPASSEPAAPVPPGAVVSEPPLPVVGGGPGEAVTGTVGGPPRRAPIRRAPVPGTPVAEERPVWGPPHPAR